MSSKGVGWAIEQKLDHATDKLVLILISEAHKVESGLAFPSVAWLVEHTGLNRKTVIRCVANLEQGGFIIDSGKRVGKTNQIKCFALNFGTVPKTELLNGKSPVFTVKSTEKGTRNKEEKNPSEAKASSGSVRKGYTSIDPDFVPVLTPAAKTIANRHSPAWLERQRNKFVDYYLSRGKQMKDWQATFRNWLDNADTRYKDGEDERSGSRGPFGDNEIANAASRLLGELAGTRQ